MAKPIKLTDEIRRKMLVDFADKLAKARLDDGKISVSQEFVYEGDIDRIAVRFTTKAWIKTLSLVHGFDSEVAWHGVVERKDDTTFVITDILVYPQVVTGVTANTDQEAYDAWKMALDDDTYNHLHMQGHSHVRMSTTPSTVDLQYWSQIVTQMNDDQFYIFMIWNKDLECTVRVYDLPSNALYETKDVDIVLDDPDLDISEFMASAKNAAKRSTVYAGAATSVSKTSGVDEDKSSGKKNKNGKDSYQSWYYGGHYANHSYNRGAGFDEEDTDYDEEIFGGRLY